MRILYPNGDVQDYGNSHGINTEYFPSALEDPKNITDTVVVAIDVLAKFGIPSKGYTFNRGVVNGYDIRNMSAQEAVRLSLAENMIDSKLVELYTDCDGMPRFIEIGGESWSAPNDGLIAKSSTKIADQTIELVVVRGYDRPPKRIVKNSKEIDLLVDGGGIVTQAIHASEGDNENFSSKNGQGSSTFNRYRNIINRYASIVYQEPSWDDSYKNGLLGSYHPKCFESLLAWKTSVREELKNAHDDDAKIELSNNSVISIPITGADFAASWTNKVRRAAIDIKSKQVGINPYRENLKTFLLRKNVYGEDIYTFENVSNFFIIGQRVSLITETLQGTFFDFSDDELSIFELSEGSEYSWSVSGPTNEILNIDFYQNLAKPGGQPVWPSGSPGFPYLPMGGGLGYWVNTAWANLSINAPSVNIYSPKGKALEIAKTFIGNKFITLAPVVIQDPPAPVYYRFRTDFDYPPELTNKGYINHEKDLVDSDPTTLQPLQTTPSMLLQNSGAVRVIDVSLPFISDGKVVGDSFPEDPDPNIDCIASDINPSSGESEITAVRDFIFKLYNEEEIETQTQYIFSGQILKGEQPFLGAKYGDNNAIINSINYTMQDESSFQTTVITGKKLVGVGSWGTEIYERRTEQVSRSGVVTSVHGNSSLYTVKIHGMGSYGCISGIRDELEVGDRVTVQVYNNCVEV